MHDRRRPGAVLLGLLAAAALGAGCSDRGGGGSGLRVGVAAVPITPCGENPDWTGPVTGSGVWGELYEDRNGNGRYDSGEPYSDDPRNDVLDAQSRGKYDGIYMAGFGNDRIARGCHDDIWARALVIDDGSRRLAIVSVDTVGMLKYGTYSGFAHAQRMLEPAIGVTDFVFSSTHSHQGPDTLGLWGEDTLFDGKFPLYLDFVDRQIARAVRDAVASLRPAVEVRAGSTDPDRDAELRGLQVRTGCRPPFVFDEELRAIAFVGDRGETIATLLNWGTHPESLEDENEFISSDFVHYIRDEVEQRVGGTAVYVSADLGAAEIVGDTCVGGADPRDASGGNEFDRRDEIGFPRTERIGRAVGGAAVRAIAAGSTVPIQSLEVRTTSYRVPASNATFELGRSIGILDLDPAVYDPALCPGSTGLCAILEQSAITLADPEGKPRIQMITVPGEVFPELYLGVAETRRTDCPAADTGLPAEPSIRAAMDAPFRLVIGLSPDELGYIVPGYDFRAANLFDEAPDPCQGQEYDPRVPRRRVPSHYHESLSIGVEASRYVTCKAVELFRGSEEISDEPACVGLP